MRPGLALALLLPPSLAAAEGYHAQFSAGLNLGLIQSQADADKDANHTIGLYGRVQMSPRWSAQLEIGRIETDDGSGTDLRQAGGLLMVDLANGGHLIPMLLAGAGFDWESTAYDSTSGHHIEGGFGLEYRADGGLTLGADIRLGSRNIDTPKAQPVGIDGAVPLLAPASHLTDGEYRSARLYVGVRF
jgi:hypothetical protein